VSAPEPCSADSLLDSLALVEAVLRKDETAVTVLLDSGDNRVQAAMMAELLAYVLAASYPDPLGMLGRMRPVLLAGQ
jgi:hypothetical protein